MRCCTLCEFCAPLHPSLERGYLTGACPRTRRFQSKLTTTMLQPSITLAASWLMSLAALPRCAPWWCRFSGRFGIHTVASQRIHAANLPLPVRYRAVNVAGSWHGHRPSQISGEQGADGFDTAQLYRGPAARPVRGEQAHHLEYCLQGAFCLFAVV